MDVEIRFDGNKKVTAIYKGFEIKTDQPVKAGGDGSAPGPFDLFLASIATCAGFYVKSFCDQRGISADGIRITQRMNHNPDTRMIDQIYIDIILPVGFPEKYKQAVILAAEQCAVKKHIASAPEFFITASIYS
ncbi:MAG: osmotically inducible protein OsmC [Bacteroidales bacterium]|nr:osmotically inducible protein OsmC [Bacteroidales bacterium]